MSKFPHQGLCQCGTMEEAAEVALKNVLATHDTHCAKWVATVFSMQYAFARALAMAATDVEVLNNSFFDTNTEAEWLSIMQDRGDRATKAAELFDALEHRAGNYMSVKIDNETGMFHLYEVLKAHYEKRAAERSGTLSQ